MEKHLFNGIKKMISVEENVGIEFLIGQYVLKGINMLHSPSDLKLVSAIDS